ncbi:RagB/SusD family nutrient uptake outer membrane protein [Niastella populi]|uniref:Carbohydrate-binding protein SusD n=1 Tax=Niastella populi TaxID=550983 RepID=A0A1V9GAU8_9BACT|nr:RagB/SusD family nutrient uptake outer membrane protein [Niastella populi]OQP67578.1 carbohydrate-binding protein SusD [Niastella populi]
MKNLKILLTMLLAMAAGSCKKYLDVVPDQVGTIDNAFTQRSTAEKFLFTCYSYLPRHGDMDDNPAFNAGDEVWYMDPIRDVDADYWNIARGMQNVANPLGSYWTGKNQGLRLFTALRDCNIFLGGIDRVRDMEAIERERWKAEVTFLKACYHFYLVRMYGPIPVIRENLAVGSAPEDVQVPREHVDSCFSYIVRLLDEAAANDALPAKIIGTEGTELGRITKSIVLAMKAKVLVTAASPLFNGNGDFVSLKTGGKDGGVPLINPIADQKKWETAAAACKEAIDFCHSNFYSLQRYNPALNPGWIINDTIKTQLGIRMAVTEKEFNTEVIWANTTSRATDIQRWTMPILAGGAVSGSGPKGILAPPIKMAELFYTNNGVPITEDKTWDYAGRFQLKTATGADTFYIKKNEQTVKLHYDREPRFYANLAFDRGIWFGNWINNHSISNMLFVKARRAEFAARQGVSNFSVTGYWIKKLVSMGTVGAADGNVTGSNQTPYPWPEIRLADLYLLYAEALNEVNGPGNETYKWIDEVRSRAGLPGVVYSWENFSTQSTRHTSKAGLRDIIHQERLIELAFEGQRFWDLRRWREAHIVLNAPIRGWSTEQQEAAAYYKPVVQWTQTFKLRDYFWPIDQDEILRNKKLLQNPGW